MEKELIMDDTDRLLSVEEVAERLRTGKQFGPQANQCRTSSCIIFPAEQACKKDEFE